MARDGAPRDLRHLSPGYEGEIPNHIGPAADCPFTECRVAHARHEAAADIQDLTFEILADEKSNPRA